MLLREGPKRDGGRLALLGESLSKSRSPAAANAFAVRGPSQSAILRGPGRDTGGWEGEADVTRFSMTLVLRLRVRTLPVSRGRSMSRLGRWFWRRLGAVPIDEGAREEGDADSASQALFGVEWSRDIGGREVLAEAEDEEGRAGVMRRDAGVRRSSLATPPLPA